MDSNTAKVGTGEYTEDAGMRVCSDERSDGATEMTQDFKSGSKNL